MEIHNETVSAIQPSPLENVDHGRSTSSNLSVTCVSICAGASTCHLPHLVLAAPTHRSHAQIPVGESSHASYFVLEVKMSAFRA